MIFVPNEETLWNSGSKARYVDVVYIQPIVSSHCRDLMKDFYKS